MSAALMTADVITGADLRAACRGIVRRVHAAAEELNALDAALGDGDLGTTLAGIGRALEGAIDTLPDDIGEAFAGIAKVIAGTSGSSFSGVMMAGLLRASRATRGKASIPLRELGPIVALCLEAMSASGGGKLGEKSVLDGIAALADALTKAPVASLAAEADHAVQEAIETFRDRPCRIGRARLAAERSIGRDDPGMVALKRMIEGIRLAGES
jgi:dihydroxyacetone kinase-like protein